MAVATATRTLQSPQVIPTIQESRKCTKCAHLNVCTIYRAIAPLINNNFKVKKPCEPEEIAQICREFMPIVATNSNVRRVK